MNIHHISIYQKGPHLKSRHRSVYYLVFLSYESEVYYDDRRNYAG